MEKWLIYYLNIYSSKNIELSRARIYIHPVYPDL